MVDLLFSDHLKGTFEGLVVVLGPNGAGKTTLLQNLHGLGKGEVFWDGQSANGNKLARGFVHQSPVMLKGSVQKNLEIACDLAQIPKAQWRVRILDVADEFDLRSLLNKNAEKLSGGEAARLAFARACLHKPEILLLDEVTAHLDPENMRRIERYMVEFSEQGVVFFVTHALGQARRLAQSVVFLDQNKILYSGEAKKFWQSPPNAIAQKFIRGEL